MQTDSVVQIGLKKYFAVNCYVFLSLKKKLKNLDFVVENFLEKKNV